MPGTRTGHRLAGVWLPAEFHRAIGLLAAARGETKSDFIRRTLVREACAAVEQEQEDEREQQEDRHPANR